MTDLSGRLKDIAYECTDSDILVDIGCDHALVPISLLESGGISFAFASDINKGPIEAAKRNALAAGVEDRMNFIVADGLSGIDTSDPMFANKKTALLISGMGGPLIEKILLQGQEVLPLFEKFVFSPHSKIGDFRRFLGKNGFSIRHEKLTKEEGKFYFIMFCTPGDDMCGNDMEYELGPGFFEEKYEEKRDFLVRNLKVNEDLCRNEAIPPQKKAETEKMRLMYKKAVKIYDMR
ncbi:MAG: class I SAM-dependent methyltransferase [Lachnospiraceae bacterium]|nr:class I SAM-dependent methyltransferase [Lachnospiraceae bacterium]